MQNISNAALELFKGNALQIARIKVNPVVGEPFNITESDILTGGFQLNRSSVSGGTIELGSVIASELLLNLDNYDGKFDDIRFEGAEIYIYVGVEKNDSDVENPTYHIVPLGYFTVDEASKSGNAISIAALDRMVWFDKKVRSDFVFNTTIRYMVESICDDCGIMLATNLVGLPNSEYKVSVSLYFS